MSDSSVKREEKKKYLPGLLELVATFFLADVTLPSASVFRLLLLSSCFSFAIFSCLSFAVCSSSFVLSLSVVSQFSIPWSGDKVEDDGALVHLFRSFYFVVLFSVLHVRLCSFRSLSSSSGVISPFVLLPLVLRFFSRHGLFLAFINPENAMRSCLGKCMHRGGEKRDHDLLWFSAESVERRR